VLRNRFVERVLLIREVAAEVVDPRGVPEEGG
jgi:hypothetical protein